MVRPILEQAVKVQRGRLIAELVIQVDDYAVAEIALKGGNRPFAVDANDGPLEGGVRIGSDPSDVEIVVDGGSRCQAYRRSQDGCQTRKTRHLGSGDLG